MTPPAAHPPVPTGLRVAVVGAGVIGLSCAHELAAAGHAVSVHSDAPWQDTVSAVAGAVWFPYRVLPQQAAGVWGARTLARLVELSTDRTTGVDVREGVVVHRGPDPDLWWTVGLEEAGGVRPATPDELPVGAPAGTFARFPACDMRTYLGWLQSACTGAGVTVVREHVADLGAVAPEADVVVVAAGLRSGDLTGDTGLSPVRGQVVRLDAPGVERWLIDDENPQGMAYVIPRRTDVVCGGTDDEGEWGTEPDPDVEAAILARCRALVPALADAPVLSRGVGLRPAAPALSLDRRQVAGREVVTCYGHGGAGVTLSWGCAEEVVRLVGAPT